MNSHDLVHLTSGSLQARLAPAIGGSIARLDYVDPAGRRFPVLRGTDKDLFHIEEAGSFPLVPYCNRIRDGRFTFRGREIVISRNKPSDASPLHGDGWLAAWDVASASESAAELRYRHEAGEWPWSYEATQNFQLDEGGLSVRIACRNLSQEPMPCGLGQHPFYPCTAETRLDTNVGDVWTVDEKILPVDKLPAAGRYDVRDRLICGQDLDNGYDQWSGEARMFSPDWPFEIRLTSPDGRFFQVYSPKGGDFFVAEPVSHANAALNEPEASWPSLGLRVLEPGEEASLHARFEVVLVP
jgi:aldose 1-epimerase